MIYVPLRVTEGAITGEKDSRCESNHIFSVWNLFQALINSPKSNFEVRTRDLHIYNKELKAPSQAVILNKVACTIKGLRPPVSLPGILPTQ